ncbi:hypothetical protein [Marinobacter sp.]|uniref:hypothetical protein n=1 Tax=Marinobacter sp. TaxID=50741 RepID=UPI003A946DB1
MAKGTGFHRAPGQPGSAGARVNAAGAGFRSDDGATAPDVARANNHRDLEMLLVQAGAEL